MAAKKLTKTEVKKIVNSCDFLDARYREELSTKVKDMDNKALEFTYRKVKDAKTQVENVYISIAISNDPTGGKLLKETLKLINQSI
jgi:hypothetical protein